MADLSRLIDQVTQDEHFQAACQRYAHANGSSAAIAAAAIRAANIGPVIEILMNIETWCENTGGRLFPKAQASIALLKLGSPTP